MDPIDYTSAFNNLPSPGASFMQGVQNGFGIQQAQLQAQQQRVALAQQQQMKKDLASLGQSPTTEAIGRFTLKYPQLSESFKRSYDMLAPGEQQAKLSHASQVYAALDSNRPDIAKQLLTSQATALRNSGMERDAGATDAMAKLIDADPQFAKVATGKLVASMMGGDKFIENIGKLGAEQRAQEQAPSDLLKKKADAAKAAADAQVAEGTVPALIQKPTEENLSAVAKRRVDEFDAEIRAADSETKRGQLTLERDKFVAEQKLKTNGVATDTQNQMDTLGQSVETVRSLLKHPGLSSGTGTGGDFRAWFNGSDAKDFRAMADTLKSQQFLTQAKEMKGMGALSDAEGARIERAVASLDYAQSTNQFKNALGVILKTLEKGQAKVVASGKLPVTGGAFVVKHPSFGDVKEGDINRLLAQFPGASREQVLMFLNQGGAK